MKLQFKYQQFQADAARSVCDVFNGQTAAEYKYNVDPGKDLLLQGKTGYKNPEIQLDDNEILANLRKVQLANGLKPSERLERSSSCNLNLTIEMETGTGKTYTYIKTMYELYKAYAWSKYIIIVPSIAIREGVYKTFQITQEHFAQEYGKKIRFFIYNSTNLNEIQRFAQDSSINVMIINSQAFNARGKDARRIDMQLDSFGSRRPIDVLAATNPILIIDEPQSVEGAVTREKLKKFAPMLTLRYSATHRQDSIYNMVYRLDALDAYNRRLVKKIEVKGFKQSGTTASTGYIYLESVNISAANPTVTLEFDYKGKNAVIPKRRIFREGDNLYDHSNKLEEYKNGYIISRIDGRDNHIEFVNGIKLVAGEVYGQVDEMQLRRLQIRETILSHLERERLNFKNKIKTLSLFFIDEVAKYRVYDKNGAANGEYAKIFEEEYNNILEERKLGLPLNVEYEAWLQNQPVERSHTGYFSIDKKSKQFINGKVNREQHISDDVDAYDLIMRNREQLLNLKEPVRFIFSHSALREGWDNPNVFQICTLKQSASDVRKRQEVGRGMRLCVNSDGERIDSEGKGPQANDINVLTVIASESYEDFTRGLQSELAEAVTTRPLKVVASLFVNNILQNEKGETLKITEDIAIAVHEHMIKRDYIADGKLTEKYWQDRNNNNLELQETVAPFYKDFLKILDSVYEPDALTPENARNNNVTPKLDNQKLYSEAFQKLWSQINAKSAYTVNFIEQELINNAINALNRNLIVQKLYFKIQKGVLDTIQSKEELAAGNSFKQLKEETKPFNVAPGSKVKYDLIGKIVEETNLTRKTVVSILMGIQKDVFDQYNINPEDFIIRACQIINQEKGSVIIKSIKYTKLDNDVYESSIFADPSLRGKLGINAMPVHKSLYDYVIYDSDIEKKFAEKLDNDGNEVEVFVKLPKTFYISTPLGKYNPDWAIVFHEGMVKYIYFVAETKGTLDSLQLRPLEAAKIKFAKEHFAAISSSKVKYGVISNYDELLNKVLKSL